MDGLTLIQHLRGDAATRNLPVIVVSGRTREDTATPTAEVTSETPTAATPTPTETEPTTTPTAGTPGDTPTATDTVVVSFEEP